MRSAAKGENIYDMYPHWRPSLSFEYVPDMVEETAFTEVFKRNNNEFDYVLHTASPVDFAVKDIQKELIDPAVHG